MDSMALDYFGFFPVRSISFFLARFEFITYFHAWLVFLLEIVDGL